MCRLCGTEEEKKLEKDELKYFAESLRDFANKCDGLATGRLKPHTDNLKGIDVSARSILRRIVEWI